MPTQTPIQNPQKPNRRLMSFKRFIAKSFADSERARHRKDMLRGRKATRDLLRKAVGSKSN